MFALVVAEARIQAHTLLFDSWDASDENLKRIRRAGWTFFITFIKRQQRVWPNATTIASSSAVSMVEVGFGPIGTSAVVMRLRHLATLFGVRWWRLATGCKLG